MASLVVLYKTPKDAKAFDEYYLSKHVPKAKAIPGLRKYEISTGPVVDPHRSFRLSFDRDPDVRQSRCDSGRVREPAGDGRRGRRSDLRDQQTTT